VALARADLSIEGQRGIMIESEITDLGATFNFVMDQAGSAW
jgi:hypothetical protein